MKAMESTLRELKVCQYMPLSEVYHEYLGKLEEKYHPKYTVPIWAVRDFASRLLSPNGLPVVIFETDKTRYVMLWEKCGDMAQRQQFGILDKIMSKDNKVNKSTDISGHFESLSSLISSSRERAIVLTCLSLIYPATQLRHMFGIHEDYVHKTKELVMHHTNRQVLENEKQKKQAQESLDHVTETLEIKILEREVRLSKKRTRVDKIGIVSDT